MLSPSSTLKTEAARPYRKSLNMYRTNPCHILEDNIVNSLFVQGLFNESLNCYDKKRLIIEWLS
jgi:hypothetical protein